MDVENIKHWQCFGGDQYIYRHKSSATATNMDFAVFVPAHKAGEKLPVLIFLSGLTCTCENFTTKAGAQRYAAEHGLILVMPDTSPRGENVPDDAAYDLGQGAGFYVDAITMPWAAHYQMWTYITIELPEAIRAVAPADFDRCGIMGHSMGGHGALSMAFRLPEKYASVSAIAPIAAPSRVPWGQKAFTAYLGPGQDAWHEYDSVDLAAKTSWRGRVLVDQGSADEFLQQLRPDLLEAACADAGIPLQLDRHNGYDHSYYFISTVIGNHIAFHAEILKSRQ